ncbi:hypothetical protein Leryth_019786 [Lithospermum erythrorhizon]|nr:hypothetical protein Leryth_019786 [Lithospermum erythrorhizon]
MICSAHPTSVRSTGTGVMCSIGNIGGVVCPLIAIVLVEGCHQGASVSLFEFVILLMIVSVLMIPVETSGRELTLAFVEQFFLKVTKLSHSRPRLVDLLGLDLHKAHIWNLLLHSNYSLH